MCASLHTGSENVSLTRQCLAVTAVSKSHIMKRASEYTGCNLYNQLNSYLPFMESHQQQF